MTAPTTSTTFPYWTSTPTLVLMTSADEYEMALADGWFADDPAAGVELAEIAANMRTEIARRVNEHWHPGSIRHSHDGGQEPHRHEGATPPPSSRGGRPNYLETSL